MSTTTAPGTDERVLVLMPTAKDGERTGSALAAAGLSYAVCKDIADLCREIIAGAGTALLTEEAVVGDRDGCLHEALHNQPPWSDFPLVVLAREGAEGRAQLIRESMNATLVERPVKVRSLLSVVRAALRSRRHQYEVRAHLAERDRAEAEVVRLAAESERQRRVYETALSNTADFNYVFDLQGRFVYVNTALLALWGKALHEAVGQDFHDLGYPPELAERLQCQIQEVINTKLPLRDETPYTSAVGTRAYEYIFVPVFGADGAVEAVAGSTRDITERKAMEESLRDADRKKDEFLALLAHELRNPLAPIRNGLQVIRLSEDREMRHDAQEMMDRQLSHMVRLIDDLLDVSRISRNKMELRRSRVPLADVVSSAVETARPLIDAGGHELDIALPARPVFLDADLTRLAQVFSNLLTNSAKYTLPGGRIWLGVTLRCGEAVVSVRDTGIGIPAESLENIFDMFSQVDRTIERSTGGLGIGLAFVKGLVEMHGGTVSAASEGQGKGSTFTVTLPVLADQKQNASTTTGNGRASSGPKRRILVVDDNRDGADSLAMMLRLTGNEVRTANDGVAAVAKAEAFQPEMILMDVGMPRLNGLDATRRIRAQDWGRGMTIIALTGWGQEGDREQSREAGCDGHLVKPVNLEDLQKLLVDLKGRPE